MLIGTFPPTTNRETWNGTFRALDQDGELIDLSVATEITIEIQNPRTGAAEATVSLTGETIAITETGVFSWSFDETDMRDLAPQNYNVGCVATVSGEKRQIFRMTLPVLDGYVT